MPTISSRNSGASMPVKADFTSSIKVINDVVVTQVYPLALNQSARGIVGTHIETKHHRTGSHRQGYIGLGDTTHAASDNIHLNFLVAQIQQGSLNRLQGTTHIGLDHHVERLSLTSGHAFKHIVQLGRLLALQLGCRASSPDGNQQFSRARFSLSTAAN